MTRVYQLLLLCAACASSPRSRPDSQGSAALSLRAEDSMLTIATGPYRKGSTLAERNQAYADYEASAGGDSARRNRWFQHEAQVHEAHLSTFTFDRAPVTQGAYAEFVRATEAPAPTINASDWKAQAFIQDYQSEVSRFNWSAKGPPEARLQHPVVLVRWKEAQAYCQWRGALVGKQRRLPTASEFEKAARGPQGAVYPWGAHYDHTRLNSADGKLRDTTAVGTYHRGQSARGAQDVAGNVFQWTSTPWPHAKGRMTVKGSAWDDHGGLGRAAAGHGRRLQIRHVIVGFRCAGPG